MVETQPYASLDRRPLVLGRAFDLSIFEAAVIGSHFLLSVDFARLPVSDLSGGKDVSGRKGCGVVVRCFRTECAV